MGKNKKQKLDRPANIEKKVISLDTDPQDVAGWDEEGVIFEYDFDSFLFLDDEKTKGLGHINKRNYFVAKSIAEKLLEQEEERREGTRRPKGEPEISSVPDKVELNLIGGSATGRTKITGGRKDTHYCLKPPESLAECLDSGYSFVDSSDPVKTPGMTKVGGSRRISSHGEDELILMKIHEETFDKHIHAVSDLSKGKRESVRDGYHEEGKRLKKKYHLEYSDQTRVTKG